MKTTSADNRYGHVSHHLPVVVLFFLLLSPQLITLVGAQTMTPPPNNNQYPYARFSPSMAIIIVVLIAALFLMGFFSIYIRHCSDSAGPTGSVRRALSMRARRAAAARGLDRSVIDTFPTFSYSEVKDHKIGKGALECAVCLNEFVEDETLRLLPKCDHVFHPECIDAWLESHVTCPVCRANLSPQTADEPVQEVLESNNNNNGASNNIERSNSRIEEIVIDVSEDQNQQQQEQQGQGGPQRSWSIRRPFGFGKFRSHSTGHSFVQPGQNLDRFTLRLPEQVRKEVMDRATLNRTRSQATTLPREGSSRRGYRTGEEEGSSRAVGRFYRRIERPDGRAKSDRWAFFTRALSMKSPKVVSEGEDVGGSSSGGGSRRATPVKMPSFKCLEPKAAAETGLFSDDPARHAV